MAMFVYRPIRPTDTTYIFAGSIVTTSSGKTFSSDSTDVNSTSNVILGNPFIGLAPTPVLVDSGSTFTGFGNRKFTNPVEIDARSGIFIRFVHMTSLRVYEDGLFKADTRELNFSGSAVTLDTGTGLDIVTVEGSGMTYSTRMDVVSDTVTYKGQAVAGASNSNAVWRISKVTTDLEGDIIRKWADGDASFDNIWDDRLTLVYS